MSQKIKEEELKELNEKYTSVQQIKMYLGDLEGQKHVLLHQLVGAQDELQKTQATLEEQYGKVSIDLKDGSYTAVEKG